MLTTTDERGFLRSEEFKKYRKFAFRDDMLKFSVGVMLGNSFNKVIQGVSDHVIMPIASYAVSNAGSGWREFEFSPVNGLRMEIGKMTGIFVDFLVVSIILYLFYIKLVGRLVFTENEHRPPQKNCPECMGLIHAEAKRCPMCTGVLVVKKRRAGNKNKGTKGT